MNRCGQKIVKWLAVLLMACFAFAALPMKGSAQTSITPSSAADAKDVPVYLNDFELSSVPAARPVPKPNGGTKPDRPADSIYEETDPPSVQARRIVDAFSTMLAEAFRKSGYTAVTRVTGSLPTEGVLLRGVFAEPDDSNRIRRTLLGSRATNPKMMLYVAVFNLGHQEQPLYLPAVVQDPDPRYGPVITLNAYLPMVKFEVPKDPTEDDVRKACDEIVNQLTKLLVQNPNAVEK
jgi:hypothetical protein